MIYLLRTTEIFGSRNLEWNRYLHVRDHVGKNSPVVSNHELVYLKGVLIEKLEKGFRHPNAFGVLHGSDAIHCQCR